jgi:hypothetical protein
MRKIHLAKSLSICLGLALVLSAGVVKANAVEDSGDNTITCPEGDTYKCYTFSNGGVVYKGKGATVITPAP